MSIISKSCVVGLMVILGLPGLVQAFEVDPLPDDNLVQNPWFRSATVDNEPGLDGWSEHSSNGVLWTLSHKISNPSPDTMVSGRCDETQPTYCGTGARWAEGQTDNSTRVNVDGYLEQIIEASPDNKILRFFTHWVAHDTIVAEVTVYASESADGPWTAVWKPFLQEDVKKYTDAVDDGEPRSEEWVHFTELTPMVQTTLDQGYPYYKLEIHCLYGEGDFGDVGVKWTGVYFTASDVALDLSDFGNPLNPSTNTDAGTDAATQDDSPDDGGCGCRVSHPAAASGSVCVWLGLLGFVLLRRRNTRMF